MSANAAQRPPGPPPGPVANLDIGAAIRDVFAFLARNPGALLRTIFLPALIASFLALLQRDLALLDPRRLLLLPLDVIPLILTAVTWHRFQLLGERPARLPPLGRPLYSYYGFFWLVWLLLFAASVAVAFPVSLLLAAVGGEAVGEGAVTPVLIVTFALSAALFFRLCFVFPAAAVGERYGLLDSWRQTKGQGVRIFVVALLTGAPVIMGTMMLSAMLAGALGLDPESPAGPPLAVLLVFSLAQLIMALPLISTLSVAFRQVSGWLPQS